MEPWQSAWQPVIDAIGSDLGGSGRDGAAADPVERGAVRRYVEPLEFDCALHHDPAVARAHGYPDVIAPYTAMLSFTIAPMWRPGRDTLFPIAERDAQPDRSSVRPRFPSFFPSFSGYFATDIDIDFMRPIHVGERVRRRGNRLVSCEPRETRVGRGAFITLETEIVSETGETVSRMRTGMFLYDPAERRAEP